MTLVTILMPHCVEITRKTLRNEYLSRQRFKNIHGAGALAQGLNHFLHVYEELRLASQNPCKSWEWKNMHQ